ncbi:hypothetical protein ACIBSS_32105 [Micromonospora aurantiaca]|uniref:hypothetical protein n=1 Tax=Micromonospora aurantiaca (nom. illeg.) TaxID=47850 RepID=UPI003798FD8E
MANTEDLPPSVVSIAEYLAMKAKGYDNHLKWNEQAMFKADLMNVRHRWNGVAPDALAGKLRSEGMREQDIVELVDWLKKAQAGRRLVPDRSYRDFVFNPPPEGLDSGLGHQSRDW